MDREIIKLPEIKRVDKDSQTSSDLLEFVENFSWNEVIEHTLWL